MKPGSPSSGSGRVVPAALPSAAAVIAAALAQTASAETRRATLDVRVTVVDSCEADSGAGASVAALGAGCTRPGRATVVIEGAAPSVKAARGGPAAAAAADGSNAPISTAEDVAGPNLRYVTIIY